MKVLYIIDSLEGYGAEKSIVQIALYMQRVTPVFIHLYNGDKLKASLEAKGIKVYSLNLTPDYGFSQAVEKIIPIVCEEKPIIIHSTLFRSEMVGRKLKSHFPQIKLVGSFVSNSYGFNRYRQLNSTAKVKLFSTQLRDRVTSHKVDYFICNSHAIKTTNMRALGISEERIRVIYRGRYFKDYVATEDSIIALKENFKIGKSKVFLNVSRLHKGKGQLDLLWSFKKLLEKYSDVKLFIAGEGPFRGELEKVILKNNLTRNVILLGYREDVSDLLALADYFVFPSYFEGLPGALIEAIISKTPCIISNIPENRECFENNSALLFEPGDIDELYRKMEEALQIENWEEKTEKSYLKAQKNFDIIGVSKEYEKFYKYLVNL